MACVGGNTVGMRRRAIPAAVTMRGTEMGNPTLHHKHHRDGEDKYPHHPIGCSNQPSNARHAMVLVISNTPQGMWGRQPSQSTDRDHFKMVVKKTQRACAF